MNLPFYGIGIQSMAKKKNLNADILTQLTAKPNQNIFQPMTIDQLFIIDSIGLAIEQDIPVQAAIDYISRQYKARGIQPPDPEKAQAISKVQTYYIMTHPDELNNPDAHRALDIFAKERKGRFQYLSGIKFKNLPDILKIMLIRGIKRDLMHFKHVTLEQATDTEIREIVTNDDTSIWAEFGIIDFTV